MSLSHYVFSGGDEQAVKDNSLGYQFSGMGARDAARDAAALQNDAAMAGIDLQRETTGLIRGDLQPYREGGIPALNQASLLSTPEGQAQFIQNNPFFDAISQQAERRLLANQAARGRVGSGDTALAMQNNLFGIGAGLLQDERNSLLGLASLGENAAAMSGTQSQTGTSSIIDLLTGNANAQGAAGMAGAQATQQGAANIASIFGSFFSDVRLKENIEYIGERNGNGWYKWDWTDDAIAIVGDQKPEGYLAQEIAVTRPDAIVERSGYLAINMEAMNNGN